MCVVYNTLLFGVSLERGKIDELPFPGSRTCRHGKKTTTATTQAKYHYYINRKNYMYMYLLLLFRILYNATLMSLVVGGSSR